MTPGILTDEPMQADFVFVDQYSPGIRWDAKFLIQALQPMTGCRGLPQRDYCGRGTS